MSYFEMMKDAASDHERMKVVEGYTNKFAAIMKAAGLEPVVGQVPSANGVKWVSFANIPAAELIDIIAAVTSTDAELGDAASELHADILACSNYLVSLEQGRAAEEPDPMPLADPDQETKAWLSPMPVWTEELERCAALITPLELLDEGKIAHVVDVESPDDQGVVDTVPMVVTLIHRNGDDEIEAISGYQVRPLADFRKVYAVVEPATMEEVAEREYNPTLGYYHHARLKLGRKVFVAETYTTMGSKSYLMEHHPAWSEDEPEPEDPTPLAIELDEERERDFAAVDAKVSGYLATAGNMVVEERREQDELERLCRVLFALKEEKKEVDADFNERIKTHEEQIRALIARRDEDRWQQRLPLDAVPDEEAEAALDAAAEESPEIAPESPEIAPSQEPPDYEANSEPEEPGPVPPQAATETDELPAFVELPDFPQCRKCGDGPPDADCDFCGGEGIEPEHRESDDDGLLVCAKCGQKRSFWAFSKYRDNRRGHICNVCRKV